MRCPYLTDCEKKNYLCDYGIFPYRRCEIYNDRSSKEAAEITDNDLFDISVEDVIR